MKISTIQAAARRHGLTAKLVESEDPDTEDDSIELSNGVSIQMSLCGTPEGLHCITTVPEWTDFHDYWDQVPAVDLIMTRALALRKKVDAHNAKHPQEVSNGR